MGIFQGLNNNNQNTQAQKTGQPSRTKSILRYTMMPEILPRIRALGLHFGHFAYLLALVFSSARLIPHNHPVLNAANIGRFGVRQVIAMAAENITWSMKNIDQIAIFGAIVMGLIMIVIQAGLIAFAALVGFNPAEAQDIGSFFETPNPAEDPMMVFFAQIFGSLDGFWGENVWQNGGGATRIHTGIRAMLSLYSMAMMVIAVIIIIYYIMTIVGEAAKTGTPFGQRFNSLWAPIRLVMALGLLVPLGSGLNSAQYTTLWVAKMGSGLGTQIWTRMIEAMEGDNGARYVMNDFDTPWIHETAIQVFILETCKFANNKFYGRDANNSQFDPNSMDHIMEISQENSNPERNFFEYKVHYQSASYFHNGHFEGYTDRYQTGGVQSYCGSINTKFTTESSGSGALDSQAVPVQDVFRLSRDAIGQLVRSSAIEELAKEYAWANVSPYGGRIGSARSLDLIFKDVLEVADTINTELLGRAGEIETEYSGEISRMLEERRNSWVYAGVWYLEIARLIQAGQDLETNSVPNTTSVDARDNLLRNGGYANPFAGAGIDSEEVAPLIVGIRDFYARGASNYTGKRPDDHTIEECDGVENQWFDGDGNNDGWLAKGACLIAALVIPEELVVLAMINDSERSVKGNRNLDPMASLISAGYSITQKSWGYILMGFGASGAGAIANLIPGVGGVISGLASFMGSVMILLGAIGLSAGLILYLLLPVFPFIYFFFAIVSWVMEIFEAIVAMPLWALAHLRIDGDGMPGQAAINGYYLLLAILLRPALIVIGLIAGAVIFSAAIYLLQTLFYKAVIVKNFGSATGLETLLYTVVFAYVAYSAAITSFKLVDRIPDSILRWIGAGVSTFSDGKEDPVGGSNQLMFAAGGLIGGQVASTMSQGASGIGKGVTDNVMQKRQKKEQGEALNNQRKFDSQQSDKIADAIKGSKDK
jgi:conjugal transfer/type IV secretion protein DotA/TraY